MIAVTRDAVWIGHARDDRGHVVRIDPTTNRIVAEVPLIRKGQGGGVGPLIAVAGEIWAATSKGLIRIDIASNRVVGVIAGDPCGQTIVENARRFWISRCFAGVMGINATTHRVDRRVSTEVKTTSVGATKHALWTTDALKQLLRIDPRKGRVVDTYDVAPVEGAEGSEPAMVSDSGSIWLADYPGGRVIRIDEPAPPG